MTAQGSSGTCRPPPAGRPPRSTSGPVVRTSRPCRRSLRPHTFMATRPMSAPSASAPTAVSPPRRTATACSACGTWPARNSSQWSGCPPRPIAAAFAGTWSSWPIPSAGSTCTTSVAVPLRFRRQPLRGYGDLAQARRSVRGMRRWPSAASGARPPSLPTRPRWALSPSALAQQPRSLPVSACRSRPGRMSACKCYAPSAGCLCG